MIEKIKIIGLLFFVFCLFSCEKGEDDTQKFETYFDSDDFVKDGLIAYYPFNGDVLDYSNHELDGTPNNVTYSTDRFGNPNGACKFSGDNSYVKIINDKLLNQGEYTICFWYRADTINDGKNRAILSKSDTIEGYAIYTTRESNLLTHSFQETRMFNGDIGYSGNTILGSSPNYWSAGEQEKFIFTCISLGDAIFVDHNSGKHETRKFDPPLAFVEKEFDLLIGSSKLPHISSAKGEIDDLLIYNRVLTTEEVLKLSMWNK